MSFNKKILVVDDKEVVCELIADALRNQDYTVVPALSAEKAYELVGDFQPDLVLLDINMPGIDGIDLMMMLKSYSNVGNTTPIIFVSALPASDTEDKLKELGAYGYIEKPFTTEELTTKVSQALRSVA